MFKKFAFVISVFLISFLLSGLGISLEAQAQGLCEPCTPSCNPGLECKDGKCYPSCPPGEVCFSNPLQACDLRDLIKTITDFLSWLVLALVPLMIIVAAFFIVTAAGDTKRLQTGQNILLYTFLGLAIVLLARAAIDLILNFLRG